MARISFFIQSKKSPAGIYVRFRNGAKTDLKAKTNFSIPPDDWSKAKGEPKSRNEQTKQLKEDLDSLRTRLLTEINKVYSNGEDVDLPWLKNFLSNRPNSNKPTTLVDYFEFYLDARRNEVSEATVRKIRVNKHWLERYEKHIRRKVKVKEVNMDFKRSFESFCVRENYAANTIARCLRYIKTICNHARLEGIETSLDLERFILKYEKGSFIYLTKDELQRIESVQFESERLDNVRDWLLISCETGQRISDFMRFNKDMLAEREMANGETRTFVNFIQEKTKRNMSLPLTARVENILKKRDGDFPPPLSHQKYNDYVKEVCQIAGITEMVDGAKIDPLTKRKVSGRFPKYELVSSHIGRRSFASNHYGTIPTPHLIYATGHSTEAMFLKYIGKADSTKADSLAEYL
jgi:hypothetical protein